MPPSPVYKMPFLKLGLLTSTITSLWFAQREEETNKRTKWRSCMRTMIMIFRSLFFLLFFRIEAHMMHQTKIESEWREEGIDPFDELIATWNAKRPGSGKDRKSTRLNSSHSQ